MLVESKQDGVNAIHCVKCGYNLHHIQNDSQCPECGQLVNLSTQERFLNAADPRWIRKLHVAVLLMLGNVPVILFASIIDRFVLVLLLFENSLSVVRVPLAVILVSRMIQQIIGGASIFLLTTRDPGNSSPENHKFLGPFLRGIAIVALAGATLSVFRGVTDPFTRIGIGVCGLAAVYGKLCYLRSLARRIPNESLFRTTRFVQWGLVSTIALNIVIVDIVVLMQGVMLTSSAYKILILPPLVALMIFTCIYCLVLFRCGVELKKASIAG